MSLKNFDLKTSHVVTMVKSTYDPKSYHLLSKQKLGRTFIYLLLLSFIINLFTTILPYAPTVFGNGGIGHVLEILLPDFEYTNGLLSIPDYKCDIDKEQNSILLIDTTKELDEEILTPYTSGIIVGQTSATIKNSDVSITNITYKNYLPLKSLTKEQLTSFKTILLIYICLLLIAIFSHLFIFLTLFVSALILYIAMFLANILIFKIKFKHKFRSIFNVTAYSLCGATILKSFLASFGIAPLPLVFNHWITIVQAVMSITIATLALIDIKRHKEANSKLREEQDSTLSESEKLDIELGFTGTELAEKHYIKEEAIKLQNEIKKNNK